MDAGTEDVAGSGMPCDTTGGMMDGMMNHDARQLIDMLIKGEQMEACLYRELAAAAPSCCLKEIFCGKAAGENRKAERLGRIAAAYGLCPPANHPGTTMGPSVGPPLFYAEEKEEQE
jgi:hypothetical protein